MFTLKSTLNAADAEMERALIAAHGLRAQFAASYIRNDRGQIVRHPTYNLQATKEVTK